MIYKVSYCVVGRPDLGAIANLNALPCVGDQVKLGDETVEVTEIIELIPPRGDFGYLHVTCQPVQETSQTGP